MRETKTRRWKRVEYDRLIELGFFRPGDPIELLGGCATDRPRCSHPGQITDLLL